MKTCKLTYFKWMCITSFVIGFSEGLFANFLERNSGFISQSYSDLYLTTVFKFKEQAVMFDSPAPPPPEDCTDLFISEYIEGSSNNKAIEIYNPTSTPIDLSSYSIRYYNGSSSAVSSTYSSWSGNIPAKSVIVVRNNNASIPGITGVADFTTTSSAFNFNGNDAVALFKDNARIDIIGPIGSSSNFAKDKTMVRKSTVGTGQSTYDSAEWEEKPQNFTDSLGNHYSSVCTVVLPPSCDTDTTFNYVGCDSLILGDSIYFASTILYDTLLNSESCDSVIITEIEIGSSYDLVLSEQFGIDSVVVNGTAYYSTQTVNLTLSTVLGCDSLVQIPIQVLNSSSIDTLGFQSFGTDANTWAFTLNQPTYNQSGDVWDEIQSFSGFGPSEGDYFLGMRDLNNNINVTNLHTISFDPIDISGYATLTFTFDYYSNLNSGSDVVNYIVEFDNGNTWGSITSLDNNTDEWITQEITIPEGSQYVRLQLQGDFNGGSDYAGYDNVLLYGISAPTACSNIDTTILTEACESYTYGDSIYTSSTQIIDSLTQVGNDCDSVVTINLVVNQPTSFTDIQSACDEFTWINGVTYTASNNTVKDTLVAVNGCDSIVTLDLTITNSVTGIDIQNACDEFTWINGITYTASNNSVKDTLVAANGCDSIVTLDLTITNSVMVTDMQMACETFTWINGVTYIESNNTAKDTLTASNGCDSIITLDLTIINTITSTDIQNACNTFTWIDGITYTESNNTAKDTLTAVSGCDSIVTLNLTIHSPVSSIDVQNACDEFTWINGITYTASNNSAKDTLVNINGCDSVITLNLTIINSVTGIDVQSACDEYTWINGVTYTESNNTAEDTLVAANGCDSIVTLDLTITNSVTVTDVQTACETFTWINGVTYTESNAIAKDTLTASNGCDSIITLDLTINNTVTSNDIQSACDDYMWINGVTYTESNNTAKDTLTATNGCDSIVTLNLTIHSPVSSVDVQSACEEFTWINGVTYTESNSIAKDTLTAASGCDSIVTLNLTIKLPVSSIDIQNACDEFTWINGMTYTASNNTAKDTLTASNGCDSIITLDLTIIHSITATDVQTACDEFTWVNGITYTESNNTAKDTLVASNGCDSIITLDLTLNNTITSTDIQSACDMFTWINGITYTESNNIAKDTLTATSGCDSIITLELTIKNSVTATDVQIACNEFTWINGVTYTESNNTAKDTLVASNGCDSIVTLDLTISTTLAGTDIQTSCGAFTWTNGVIYTESNNTAKDTITAVGGCDSIVTLNLEVLESTYATHTVSEFGAYTWTDGITYTESNNSAMDTLINAQGCDSIITLDLTILQEYCTLRSTRNRYEWIKQVELGNDINNMTSAESGGYGYYDTDTLIVDTNEVVNIALTPGYKRRAYDEYWRIWVDWNYDGDFNDLGEKVFEQKGKYVRTGSFNVPVNVSSNDLRVRVAMRWKRYAPSCGAYSNGEVEDYIMRVNGAQGALNLDLDGRLAYTEETTEPLYEFAELYPNPVFEGGIISGYIRVEALGNKTLQITNTLGQIVKTLSIHCNEEETRFEIPTNGLVKGMYFMTIDNGQETTKIIVN